MNNNGITGTRAIDIYVAATGGHSAGAAIRLAEVPLTERIA